MNKRISLILMIVLVIAGVGFLLYPTVSELFAVYSQDMTIRYHDEALDQMDSEQIAAQWEKAREYNEQQAGVTFSDPFDSKNDNKLAQDYLSVLDIDDVMGYIEIPQINVYLPIYHGTSDMVLKKGSGHLAGSGLPIGGKGNHTVLTSHSGLPSAKLFTDLELIELGDVFYIHVLDEILAYEVDQILVVEPKDIKALLPEDGEDYVTLITCTPYAINSHRLFVRGSRIELIAEEKDTLRGEEVGIAGWPLLIIPLIATLLIKFLVDRLLLWRRRKNL